MKRKEDLYQDNALLVAYNNVVTILQSSGILDILMQNATPRLVPPSSTNYTHLTTVEYGRSLGYREALEDMLFFRERFLTEQNDISVRAPDFQGASRAVSLGNITQEELDAIRFNTKPNYSSKLAGI